LSLLIVVLNLISLLYFNWILLTKC
jgi:hypothetical protein